MTEWLIYYATAVLLSSLLIGCLVAWSRGDSQMQVALAYLMKTLVRSLVLVMLPLFLIGLLIGILLLKGKGYEPDQLRYFLRQTFRELL